MRKRVIVPVQTAIVKKRDGHRRNRMDRIALAIDHTDPGGVQGNGRDATWQ
jgi:hypothetical protein